MIAWRGSQVVDGDWAVGFDTLELDDLVAHASEVGTRLDRGEVALPEVIAPTSPGLERFADWLAGRLFQGHGFALVRNLPVDDLGETAGRLLFWMLGRSIGRPLRQNAAGDLLVRVRDQGGNFDRPGVRAYETTAHLDYHTDSADVVALLCRRPAVRGGVSTIVSSVAVFEEIQRRRPDLASTLLGPWPELNPVDASVAELPIVARTRRGMLSTRYGRKYTELAAERSGQPLADSQVEALDLYDEVTNDPDFVLDMHFRPGDVQFLNNQVVLHARTAYEDTPDPATRRELWRLWLVVPGLDLPDVFADAGFIPRSAAIDT